MAMASRLSVTVSMAADTSGILSLISRVNLVATSTWVGMTSDGPGSSKTSSKVSPSRISMRLSGFAGRIYAGADGRRKGSREPAAIPPSAGASERAAQPRESVVAGGVLVGADRLLAASGLSEGALGVPRPDLVGIEGLDAGDRGATLALEVLDADVVLAALSA